MGWSEVYHQVKQLRAHLTPATSSVPNSFTFLEPSHMLAYLGTPSPSEKAQELMVKRLVESPTATEDVDLVEPLLGKGWQSSWTRTLSKEEQLLRERQRMTASGVTSYVYSPELHSLLFSSSGTLFRCVLPRESFKPGSLVPEEISTKEGGARMDPKFCPSNHNLVSFVRNGELWVVYTHQGIHYEHKLTESSSQKGCYAGSPSYIVQEEFDRYTAYWWAPSPSPDTSLDTSHPLSLKYHILYEDIDESMVDEISLPSFSQSGAGSEPMRYPRPGQKNGTVQPRVAEIEVILPSSTPQDDRIESGPTLTSDSSSSTILLPPVVFKSRLLKLPLSMQNAYPSHEYIVRLGWFSDSFVWLQLLDRLQQNLQLVVLPLSSFSIESPLGPSSSTEPFKIWVPQSVILSDHSDVWINVPDVFEVLHCRTAPSSTLPSSSSDLSVKDLLLDFEVVWTSELSGFRHLELLSFNSLTGLRRTPMTQGSWVVDSYVCVLASSQRVYFTSTLDTPLETHLYVIIHDSSSPSGWSTPVRITSLGSSHPLVCVSPRGDHVALLSSSLSAPHTCTLHKLSADGLSLSSNNEEAPFFKQQKIELFSPPQPFSFINKSGIVIHGHVYLPPGHTPGVTYPTVLYVYGGPHVQLVTNEYKAVKHLRLHILAQFGFVVVVVDGCGATRRGLSFEAPLRLSMGTVELADQIAALEHLAAIDGNPHGVDMKRVGVHGWSYGGYLSLVALATRPDVFKAAVSGAPVSAWELYDTGYTERYMATPALNPQGYAAGSVLKMAASFPDEEDRLLLVHGLIDENVHFTHTALLIDALCNAGKPHQVQVYPNERHGVRSASSLEHFETRLVSFFLHALNK